MTRPSGIPGEECFVDRARAASSVSFGAAGSSPPRLSLCMIVRDSSRTLRACLESIRPYVDEMVVVDTGSVDDTREIAASLGARVFEFSWCDDFATARNESIRHARGQWLFWMDSDDTISPENGAQLFKLVLGPHRPEVLGYTVAVHCPASEPDQGVTVVDHIKLFRNREGLRFEFRIHEQLLPAIRRLGGEVEWTDLFVAHSGSDHSPEGRRRKQARDLRLLKLELTDRPDHPFALFNMGMTLADMEQHADAVEYLRRSLSAAAPGESHVRKAYALLIGSLGELGRNEEALAVCHEALEQFSDDPELHFRAATAAHRLGRLADAERGYRAALRPVGERFFASRDSGISGYKARHNLAMVYEDMERYDLAELQWREAIAAVPRRRESHEALGRSLLAQRKLATAEVEAEARLEDASMKAVGALFKAETLLARGDTAAARILLIEAVAEFPDDSEPLQTLCRLLFEHGPLEVAVAYQERLAALCPDDPAAHHNLGSLRLRLGDPRGASQCFERSLALRPDAPQTRAQLAVCAATEV